MRVCARCRRFHGALRGIAARRAVSESAKPDNVEIADQVPADSAGRHARSAFRSRSTTTPAAFCSTISIGAAAISLALIGPAGTRSYGELCAEASRWGNGLASRSGLQRGDRVLMFLDDTPAYPAAFFGAVRAGLVPLLINTLTPPDLCNSICRIRAPPLRSRTRNSARASTRRPARTRAAHADRRSTARRAITPRRTRLIARHLAAGLFRRSGGSRHPSQRNGVLDVFVGLDRPAKGIVHLQHDMAYSEAAFARNRAEAQARTTSAFRCRRSSSPTASATPSPFRFPSAPRRCCCRASPSRRRFSRRSSAFARRCFSDCRRSIRR